MRVFITGGTGFIGSLLALRCLERGDQVRVLGQQNTPAETENRKEIERAGARVILGSVTDADLLADLLVDTDVVFHLAAAQHEMNVPDARFWEVNVEGTRNVVEASVNAGVERFVHGSTIGVYGSLDGAIEETSPTIPDNIYGQTKLEGERVVLSYRDRLPVVVVRIPEVYGPGDRRLLKLFRSIDRQVFFLVGSGKNLHHAMYIDDLIQGLQSAAEAPQAIGEILLLAGKEAVTTAEMVSAVARALDTKPPRIRAPMSPFLILATLLEVTLRPLGIQPPLHRRRLDFFRKSFRLDSSRSEHLLNFQPRVTFDEGARLTAAWYRARGHLN